MIDATLLPDLSREVAARVRSELGAVVLHFEAAIDALPDGGPESEWEAAILVHGEGVGRLLQRLKHERRWWTETV